MTASHGWLADQLPAAMAADPFLRRFMAIFEDIAGGLRTRVDGIEHAVDVGVAPPPLVRWLGGWLAVHHIDPSLPEARQRALVRAAGRLLLQRGTAGGLRQVVEQATGAKVAVDDPGTVLRRGEPMPRRAPVVVRVDRAGKLGEARLLALVRSQLPVDAELELWVGDHRVFPPPAARLALGPGAPRARRERPLRAPSASRKVRPLRARGNGLGEASA